MYRPHWWRRMFCRFDRHWWKQTLNVEFKKHRHNFACVECGALANTPWRRR